MLKPAIASLLLLATGIAPAPAKACGSHGYATTWTPQSSGARNLAEVARLSNEVVKCHCYVIDGRDLQAELSNAMEGVSASGVDALVVTAGKHWDRAVEAVRSTPGS